MPDTLTPEEIAAIRERLDGEGHELAEPCRKLLAHIDALTAAVEGLDTHEGHAYEPGIEWLCVTSGDPPRSTDCGDDAAHYRLIDRAAVLAMLRGRAVIGICRGCRRRVRWNGLYWCEGHGWLTRHRCPRG